MILKNAEVFNGDFEKIRADVKIDGEKISKIGNFSSEDGLDLTGLVVMPGLIDMHIHGCGGADTGDATPEALETMSQTLVKNGVTSFCPASMTLSFEELTKIFATIDAMKDKVGGAYIHAARHTTYEYVVSILNRRPHFPPELLLHIGNSFSRNIPMSRNTTHLCFHSRASISGQVWTPSV